MVEQSMASLEWKSDGHISLNRQDNHPQHSHGDGDLVDGVGEVGHYSVIPFILVRVMVINNDIVKQEEKD